MKIPGTRFGPASAGSWLALLWLVAVGGVAGAAEPPEEEREPSVRHPSHREPSARHPAERRSVDRWTAVEDGGDPDEEHGDSGHDDPDHGEGGHGDGGHGKGGHGHSSRISDEYIPLQKLPERPAPPIELGEPFLGTGTLDPGFRLPTGAVWQPSLLLFGNFRSAVQSFEPDTASGGRITEWTNRLDLFFNLQLSGTERLVLGLRALDQDGRFTGYFLEHPDPNLDGDFRDELNVDIGSLYFEGDFGEIFPDLDRDDFASYDLGFSVGRQPLIFQEGLLINDTIDGVGITRNTLLPKNAPNFRSTLFFGWGDLNTSAFDERDAQLFALLTSTDFKPSTVDVDIAWLDANDGSGDLLAAGVSAVQRLGETNSSFFLLGSRASGDETDVTTDGLLLFAELGWTPKRTHDYLYLTSFAAFDEYTPAARGVGPAGGGPLGRAGINFASPNLGSYAAPLSSRARDVVGGAVGYQRFYDHTRKQLLLEVGGRVGTAGDVGDGASFTARYQAAFGQHFVFIVDGFAGYREGLAGIDDLYPYGGRVEILAKF